MVRCNESDEVDMPPEAPAYTSYVDPNTGEPSPTFGARTPLPGRAFWGEDMERVVRSGQASTPSESPRKSSRDYVSKRKEANVAYRNAQNSRIPNEFEEDEDEEEDEEEEEDDFIPLTQDQIAATRAEQGAATGRELWYTQNDPEHDPIKESVSQMAEDAEEEDSEDGEGEPEKPDGGATADTTVAGLVSKAQGALVPEAEPLSNNELWWNWQKPPKEREPWSAWHKRSGDSDSVSLT